jgi:hypothetical protein
MKKKKGLNLFEIWKSVKDKKKRKVEEKYMQKKGKQNKNKII